MHSNTLSVLLKVLLSIICGQIYLKLPLNNDAMDPVIAKNMSSFMLDDPNVLYAAAT